MKNFENKNYHVEFTTEGTYDYNKRKVFYRVLPSELSLWDRVFNNKWVQLYRPSEKSVIGFTYLYTVKDYQDEIAPLNRLYEVERYIQESKQKISDLKTTKYLKGEIWYDQV